MQYFILILCPGLEMDSFCTGAVLGKHEQKSRALLDRLWKDEVSPEQTSSHDMKALLECLGKNKDQ